MWCKKIQEEFCPACKTDKRGMWKNKEGVYKHIAYGCGFIGKKKGKRMLKKLLNKKNYTQEDLDLGRNLIMKTS